MDRRNLLKIIGMTAVVPSCIVNAPPVNKWFTHKELMFTYNAVNKVNNVFNIEKFKFSPLQSSQESFYYAIYNASNYTHRRTCDDQSKRWIVVSPSICDRGLFNKKWGASANFIQPNWRCFIQDEVSPGVFLVGTINFHRSIYVDERFPEGVALQGIGYKEVPRYKYDKQLEEWTFKLGPPTTNHYWLINANESS